jgi:hypothetical protein
MSNYYISTLAPGLAVHGPGYLLSKLSARLTNPSAPSTEILATSSPIRSLDATASLLLAQVSTPDSFKATIDDLVEAGWTLAPATSATGSTAIPVNPSMQSLSYRDIIQDERGMKALSAKAFIQLLQFPVRLTSPEAIQHLVPELLYFDVERLALIRDLVDKISLQAVLAISSRQILAKLGRMNRSASQEAQELEFLYRLDVLLSAEDVEFNHIATEVLRHVTAAANVSKTLSIEGILLEDYIKRAVQDVIKAKNPILQLLFKRIIKLILRGILGLKHQEKLATYSLQAAGIAKNIDKLIDMAAKLFQTNWKVYGPIYILILSSHDFTRRIQH